MACVIIFVQVYVNRRPDDTAVKAGHPLFFVRALASGKLAVCKIKFVWHLRFADASIRDA